MIPYARQSITQEDIDAVVEVLQSERLTQGPAVPAFEQALVALTGAAHALATNSATSALHLACLALEVGPGDVVWTSPNTYVASANCARFCGADVDFVDIEAGTGNLSVAALEHKLQRAETLPKVVVVVHFAGQSCDMPAIRALADRYQFRVIEDASHALGAYCGEFAVGSCHYSDITVFSFHAVKIATTGEGGALLCRDDKLAQRAELLRSHGVTRDSHLLQDTDAAPWVYEQQALGFNFRMTEMQAALGCSQLQRLEQFVSRRRELAALYADAFAQAGIEHLPVGVESSGHLFVLQVAAQQRRRIFDDLSAKQIGVNVHYMPVYWQPYYRQLGFDRGLCPVSEQYYSQAITLPLFPGLTDEQQAYVIDQVRAAVG